jgi:hypothetical protein
LHCVGPHETRVQTRLFACGRFEQSFAVEESGLGSTMDATKEALDCSDAESKDGLTIVTLKEPRQAAAIQKQNENQSR